MAKKKTPKGPKTLYDKVKEIDPVFIEEVYKATDLNLNERLSVVAKEMTRWENELSEDMDIKSLQEQLKTARETYTKPLNALKLKRKLVYKILGERGKLP
jgi:hypothetical protein